MTALVKPIAIAAVFVLAVFAIGRAWDYELATAAPPDTGGIGTALVVENATYQGKGIRWWARRAVQNRKNSNARGLTIRRLRRELERADAGAVSPVLAIRFVFGQYAGQALHVSWCESRYDTGAKNGQYLGLFQMGTGERARWGHSGDALGQAQAAYRYFVASGRDWSPWDPLCRP